MSESVGSSEFLLGIEEYLRYLKNDSQANSVHTLARTISSELPKENSIKAFFQDFSAVISDRNKADLLHNIVKSNNVFDSQKSVLHYLGKILEDTFLVDFIYELIKLDTSLNYETIYKPLLKYVNKVVENQPLNDLIHGLLTKSTNVETGYKIILQHVNKVVENQPLNDLIHGFLLSLSIENSYKLLLQYINRSINDKNLNDLIHGISKSNNLLAVYKYVLQYIGKTINDNESISVLSLAIQRSLEVENFEDEFIKSLLAMLDRQFLKDKIFRGINNYLKNSKDRKVINDAFSRSQVKSKIWLIEELNKLSQGYFNVVVMAGWFGQVKSIYDKKLTYRKMRIVELDKDACETSDYIFNLSSLEDYKVKSVHADINKLTLHKNGYEWPVENFKENTKYSEKFLPDLIINTSAEHMTEEWFHQIRFKAIESNPIVAIQSNNLFDIPEHVNCVHSIDHMKKKFPMREILFEGELQLKGYKRVMIIGRP